MICCPGQGRRHEFRRFGAYYRQIIGKERGNHAGYGPCENVYPVRIVSGGVPGRVHPGARGARPGHQRPSAGGMPSGGPGGGGQLPGGSHRGALKAAACGASPGRICPVGAGDSAGPFLLPVPGGQSRPPLQRSWGTRPVGAGPRQRCEMCIQFVGQGPRALPHIGAEQRRHAGRRPEENMSCRGRRLCRPFFIAGSGRTESSAPTDLLGGFCAGRRGRRPLRNAPQGEWAQKSRTH